MQTNYGSGYGCFRRFAIALAWATALAAAATAAWGQTFSSPTPPLQKAPDFPVSPAQRATATEVAQAGVLLTDLAPNAPDEYTIKRGDTLWSISGLFLRSPWRWPELWGMNLLDIRNPHRIYPGQLLYLDKVNGRATLRTRQAASGDPVPEVRLSPTTRYEAIDASIPTLPASLIEPFLTEPMIVDAKTFERAPRLVATQEGRVLLSRGDRAYARGQYAGGKEGQPLSDAPGQSRDYRVFRNATALKDPASGEVLGYEAQFVGRAELIRGETPAIQGTTSSDHAAVPATLDIRLAKEEIRIGDRLLAEPPRTFLSYVPRAPVSPVQGQILSIYSKALYASQNQVVVLNRGTLDGLEAGHVMAIVKNGELLMDRTDTDKPTLKLPNERNGLLMVFRTFDRVSYALVLQINDGVKVGDRFINPN